MSEEQYKPPVRGYIISAENFREEMMYENKTEEEWINRDDLRKVLYRHMYTKDASEEVIALCRGLFRELLTEGCEVVRCDHCNNISGSPPMIYGDPEEAEEMGCTHIEDLKKQRQYEYSHGDLEWIDVR